MFSAYTLSTLGDWLDMLAIFAMLAYTWQADPIVIALLPITFALPGIILSSFAGVLADRCKKVHLMIITDALSALLTIGLIFSQSIYLVLIILAVRSSIGLFNGPAQQALTRSIVTEKQLIKATSYNQIISQVAKIGGPILGGVILAFFTAQVALLINAISFLLSALILYFIRNIKEQISEVEEGEKKKSFKESWHEGWAYIFQNSTILNILLIGLVASLFLQLVDSQFAVLFRSIAPGQPSLIGWGIATVGFGSILSITWLNRRSGIKYGLTLGLGCSLLGIGFLGIGALNNGFHLLLLFFLGIIAGVGNGFWMVTYNFALQNESPKYMVGRVYGIVNMIMSVVFIVAPLLGGTLIHFWGPTLVFQLVGLCVTLFGVIVMLLRNKLFKVKKAADRPLGIER